jgi:hypothetical protein
LWLFDTISISFQSAHKSCSSKNEKVQMHSVFLQIWFQSRFNKASKCRKLLLNFRALLCISCYFYCNKTKLKTQKLFVDICRVKLSNIWMAAKPNAKYFKCDTCDYSTTNRGHINQHTRLVHLKVKNYKCTQCSYKCGQNAHLKNHINTVHLKRRDFKCDHCDKAHLVIKDS